MQEKSGVPQSKFYEGSWQKFYASKLDSILAGTENGDRYVRYIVEERRKAGLPELEDIPENWRQMGKRCVTPHRDQLRYPYPDYYLHMVELGWPQTQTVHDGE
jgi:hypothetical protein